MIWLIRRWLELEDKILASLAPMDEAWLNNLRRRADDEHPVSVGRK